MYIKLSVPIILLVTCFRACTQKELYTPTLKNQHNQEINWKECKYVIIGNRKNTKKNPFIRDTNIITF